MAETRVVIAFDADLLRGGKGLLYKPNASACYMMTKMSEMKNVKVVVWSEKGKDYADKVVHKLNLRKYVWRVCDKSSTYSEKYSISVAFGDENNVEGVATSIIAC